jgi:hypothetical protein
LCPDRSFILCDCEGFEAELLTSEVAGALADSDLVVELHGARCADTPRLILDRFSPTHDVQVITARKRCAAHYAELADLALEEDRFVDEFREAGQQWAVLSARRPAISLE